MAAASPTLVDYRISAGGLATLRAAVEAARWAGAQADHPPVLNSSSLFFALVEVGAVAADDPPGDADLAEDLRACVFLRRQLALPAEDAPRPHALQRESYLGRDAPLRVTIPGRPSEAGEDLPAFTPSALQMLDQAAAYAARTDPRRIIGARHLLAALLTFQGEHDDRPYAHSRLREAGLPPPVLARRFLRQIRWLAPRDREDGWEQVLTRAPEMRRADVFALAFFLVVDGRLPVTSLEHPEATKLIRVCRATLAEFDGPEALVRDHAALLRLEHHLRQRSEVEPHPLWLSWMKATESAMVEDFERLLER